MVIVGALGLGGWLVWKNNDRGDTNRSNTRQQQPEAAKKETKKPSDPSDGGKYLVIAEWGVRFPLPEDLRGDVRYGIETYPDGQQTAWFEVGKIAELPGSNCKLTDAEGESTGKTGGLGVFIWRTTKETSNEQAALATYPNKHLGRYWYSAGRGKYADACVNNTGNRQLSIDKSLALTYALENLELLE